MDNVTIFVLGAIVGVLLAGAISVITLVRDPIGVDHDH
jgi:hypothetical protein